jgi:hypothetical protein
VVDEDVVASTEFQACGDEAQGERCGADEGDFLRLATQQLGAEFAREGQLREHEFLLVTKSAFCGTVRHSVGDAAGQGTDPGVGEEYFSTRDRKLLPSQFLVR